MIPTATLALRDSQALPHRIAARHLAHRLTIRESGGAVVGASRIGDVTQRRLAEQSIAELQARLVALTGASGTLLCSPIVDDVVKATLAVARDLLPADAYGVWRRHPSLWRVAG
jgi:hypothetical protein